MISPVLSRTLERFPVPVRTLDALHLASIELLREQSIEIKLATYDSRMLAGCKKAEDCDLSTLNTELGLDEPAGTRSWKSTVRKLAQIRDELGLECPVISVDIPDLIFTVAPGCRVVR